MQNTKMQLKRVPWNEFFAVKLVRRMSLYRLIKTIYGPLKKNYFWQKKLVFLIHGFQSDGKVEWMKQLSSAYLQRVSIILPSYTYSTIRTYLDGSTCNFQRDVIVFIVDWGSVARNVNYFDAVGKSHCVAKKLIW